MLHRSKKQPHPLHRCRSLNKTLLVRLRCSDHGHCHCTEELREWVKRHQDYHRCSRTDSQSLSVQEGYVWTKISIEEFSSRCPKLRASLGPDGAIHIIEDEFLLHYSLLTRRCSFFITRQTPGQAFSNWAYDLKRKGAETDLRTLTVDQLLVLRYITGTCDRDLLTEPGQSYQGLRIDTGTQLHAQGAPQTAAERFQQAEIAHYCSRSPRQML